MSSLACQAVQVLAALCARTILGRQGVWQLPGQIVYHHSIGQTLALTASALQALVRTSAQYLIEWPNIPPTSTAYPRRSNLIQTYCKVFLYYLY